MDFYCPQTKFAKVMFLQVSVCPQGGGGMRGCQGGMHGWGCAWLLGGMHGCWGHVWLLGGMHGCWGTCVVAGGHAWLPGGMHGCQGGMRRIRRDTVNERAVRILLECILVIQ